MQDRFEVTIEGSLYRKSFDEMKEAVDVAWVVKGQRRAFIKDWYNGARFEVTGANEVTPLLKEEVRRPLGGYANDGL